ncbi:hypothetical protein [Sphingobacterium endophyticum]|uniref:hypothetical protein n=1 Tax=Sphingobacterium endophyticum TaxID=2546448 RepID=UPI0012E26449|nr:hypothetical protein [Sphingobacterium endophyticum]
MNIKFHKAFFNGKFFNAPLQMRTASFYEVVNEDDGSQWGNFPQSYSHVGLMNGASRIAIKLDRPISLNN